MIEVTSDGTVDGTTATGTELVPTSLSCQVKGDKLVSLSLVLGAPAPAPEPERSARRRPAAHPASEEV